MSVKHRLGAGVTLMSLAIWIEQALGFVTFLILARVLGVETVGVAMMAIAIILFGETLVRETFSDFLIQRTDLEDGHQSAAFWLLTGCAVLMISALYLAAPFIADLYDEPQTKDLLRAGSLTILFVALAAVPVARLRRKLSFNTLAWRTVIGPIVGAAAGVGAAFAGWGAWSIIVQRLAQGIITDGIVWFADRWRPDFSAHPRHFADVWRYSARMLGFRAAEMIGVQTPNFVIGAVLGSAALGLYTAAWRLADVLSFLLVAPVHFVAQPAFAAARRGDGGDADLLRDVSRASSLISFASFAGLAAVAPALLVLLFGPQWAAAGDVLRILAIAGLYFTIEKVHQAYCLAMGRAGTMFVFSILEALLGFALVLFASPYGVHAVAWAFVARCLVMWPVRMWFTHKLSGVDLRAYLSDFITPLCASLAMALCVALVRAKAFTAWPSFADLAASVIMGVAIYGAFLGLFMRGRLHEAFGLVRAAQSSQQGPVQVKATRS